MSIREFLDVRISEAEFPTTNALQARIGRAPQAGDKAEDLASALAFAVLDLEIALVNAKAERRKLRPTFWSWKRESSTPASNLRTHKTNCDAVTCA